MSFVIQYHHLVFGTFKNQHLITPPLEPLLHNYLFGIGRNNRIVCHAIGGVSNHVHLLISIPSTISLSEAARILKCNSSTWVNEERLSPRNFGWREGYGAFSVSPKQVGRVIRYISNQKEHHRVKGFTEECETMLRGLPDYNPAERSEHSSWFKNEDDGDSQGQ